MDHVRIDDTCIRTHTCMLACIIHTYTEIYIRYTEGARWSSGINAANGASGPGSRPVYYLS